VLHFQFVNWPNLQIKQSWYRCMERIRQPQRLAAEINKQYAPSEDESGLQVRAVPADWLEGYAGLDAGVFGARDERRVREVLGWFREHGAAHFADLDIWRVDWAALCSDETLAAAIAEARQNAPVAPKTFPIPLSARRHMATAGEHLARRDLASCRKSVECALAEAPEHPEILAALGNMELVAKEFAPARKHFEQSLRLNSAQPKVWSQLAAAQLHLKNRAGFLQGVQKALELDAKCAPALRQMADYQMERGQHRPAAGAYRQLAGLEPRNAGVRLLLGQALAAAGETEEAVDCFRQALALEPTLAAARRALDTLSKSDQTRKAAPAEACAR
jgi:tetratricopeptide (TPR) repeat protein